MRQRFGIFCIFAALGLSLTGCASTPAPGEDSTPKLVGSTTTQGNKGFPFGSSDAVDFLRIAAVSPDPDYGFSEESPILLGGTESGPRQSRLYLNSLRGPEGQVIVYERSGSCCPFKTKNSSLGTGLLDVYLVTYEGRTEPILLYVNMYDPGELFVPQGFTARR